MYMNAIEKALSSALVEQAIDAAPTSIIGGIITGHPQGTVFSVASMFATDIAAQRGAQAALEALAEEEADVQNQ